MRELAAATPVARDRVVDLVRIAAVAVVVIWHTTLSLLYFSGGRLEMPNPIDSVPDGWVATWLLQVMPVFFAVGGYVHLTAWRSAPSAGAFLRRRAVRLGRPLLPFVAVWAAVEAALLIAGRPPLLVTAPGVLAPMWFLLVYAGVALLVPWTARLHDRWGLWVPVVGAALVAGLDALRLAGVPLVWLVSTGLVWVLCHQLGYLWRDGMLGDGPRTGLPIAAGAVVGLILCTGPGPYPPSMVSTATQESNLLPATPPVLLVCLLQVGLALALRPWLARLLRRPRWWRPVVAANAVTMSVYLWHMTAAMVVVGAYAWLVGPLPTQPTAAWWWTRPLWLAAVLLVLAGIVALVRRFELPPAPREGARRAPGSVRAAPEGGGQGGS